MVALLEDNNSGFVSNKQKHVFLQLNNFISVIPELVFPGIF